MILFLCFVASDAVTGLWEGINITPTLVKNINQLQCYKKDKKIKNKDTHLYLTNSNLEIDKRLPTHMRDTFPCIPHVKFNTAKFV